MKAILTIFLVLGFFVGKSHSVDTLKYWDRKNKLNWNDFIGTVPEHELHSDNRAVCPHEIIVSPFRKKGILNYEVSLIFLKKEAWTKDSSLYTLAHEQLHFDIGELYARKLRKSIKQIRAKVISKDGDFKETIEKLISEEHKAQDQYDNETAHGIYEKHQKEWNNKVLKELESLKEYASDLKNCK